MGTACRRNTRGSRNGIGKMHVTCFGRGFYNAVNFSKERGRADSKTEVAGNATLLGQVATFMENLHLTYNEVMDEIPYRNLIIMQRDKLHAVYGDKIQEVSARSMAGRKNIIKG